MTATDYPASAQLVEVGPRDGLQSQPVLLSTAAKLSYIRKLVAAGLTRIEVASFVNPKRVPQMADIDDVVAELPDAVGVRFSGLVLNARGCERALASGLGEINFAVMATDAFNQRNQGADVAATLETIGVLCREAKAAGRFCSITIGASFGCPYTGEVPVDAVTEIVRVLARFPFDELALADTIGVASPLEVETRVLRVRELIDGRSLRLHFHDTRNTAIANVFAGLRVGVGVFDASCGGVGGCPFAPDATGNVATEDVVYALTRSGVDTGVDIQRLLQTSAWLREPLGAPVPSMVSRAGVFPPPA